MVRLLGAQELPSVVVVNLEPNAGWGVAVVVSTDEVHLATRSGNKPGDLVGAVLYGSACGALRHVVLRRVAPDPGVPAVGRHVSRGVIFLEIEPKLEVVAQWLILPRHLLVCVQQVPAVVAGAQAASIRPDIASGVVIAENRLARKRIAPQWEPNLFARCEVLDGASALAKWGSRNRTNTCGRRYGVRIWRHYCLKCHDSCKLACALCVGRELAGGAWLRVDSVAKGR
mmetsp:Transcript_26851/g.70511  ORF Transcript_26851/g.70511 Transcript_26851/m.70511 type:complete len:228 (-) Transcript_26851:1957-2640(-)